MTKRKRGAGGEWRWKDKKNSRGKKIVGQRKGKER